MYTSMLVCNVCLYLMAYNLVEVRLSLSRRCSLPTYLTYTTKHHQPKKKKEEEEHTHTHTHMY